MSGPKHLWSGDWERDSAAAADNLPPAPSPRAEPPNPVPPPEPGGGTRGPQRSRILAVSALVLVIGVGIAIAATSGGGGAKQPATAPTRTSSLGGSGLFPQLNPGNGQTSTTRVQTTPQQQPNAVPVPSEPTVDWLGMQIQDSTSGAPVIDTVNLSSAADTAGFDPGDQIVAINGKGISSVAAIGPAVASVGLGRQIEVVVDRGTTTVTLDAVLTSRPIKQP